MSFTPLCAHRSSFTGHETTLFHGLMFFIFSLWFRKHVQRTKTTVTARLYKTLFPNPSLDIKKRIRLIATGGAPTLLDQLLRSFRQSQDEDRSWLQRRPSLPSSDDFLGNSEDFSWEGSLTDRESREDSESEETDTNKTKSEINWDKIYLKLMNFFEF